MKSIYYLAFIGIYFFYTAYRGGLYSDLSKWKILAGIIFLLIPAIYWIYDRAKGKRR